MFLWSQKILPHFFIVPQRAIELRNALCHSSLSLSFSIVDLKILPLGFWVIYRISFSRCAEWNYVFIKSPLEDIHFLNSWFSATSPWKLSNNRDRNLHFYRLQIDSVLTQFMFIFALGLFVSLQFGRSLSINQRRILCCECCERHQEFDLQILVRLCRAFCIVQWHSLNFDNRRIVAVNSIITNILIIGKIGK